MTDKIAPALSPEEWREVQPDSAEFQGFETEWGAHHGRHQTAALALYGQPFGFTWEDVAMLRGERFGGFQADSPDFWDAIAHLVGRIEALLPPRQL